MESNPAVTPVYVASGILAAFFQSMPMFRCERTMNKTIKYFYLLRRRLLFHVLQGNCCLEIWKIFMQRLLFIVRCLLLVFQFISLQIYSQFHSYIDYVFSVFIMCCIILIDFISLLALRKVVKKRIFSRNKSNQVYAFSSDQMRKKRLSEIGFFVQVYKTMF